jgi:hypothetical protein
MVSIGTKSVEDNPLPRHNSDCLKFRLPPPGTAMPQLRPADEGPIITIQTNRTRRGEKPPQRTRERVRTAPHASG